MDVFIVLILLYISSEKSILSINSYILLHNLANQSKTKYRISNYYNIMYVIVRFLYSSQSLVSTG